MELWIIQAIGLFFGILDLFLVFILIVVYAERTLKKEKKQE